jgi:hypothetical protein
MLKRGKEKKVVPTTEGGEEVVPGYGRSRRVAIDMHVLENDPESSSDGANREDAVTSATVSTEPAPAPPTVADTVSVTDPTPKHHTHHMPHMRLPPLHKAKKDGAEVVQQPKTKLERHVIFIEALIGSAECLEHAFEQIDYDKDLILGKNDLKQATKSLKIEVFYDSVDRSNLREALDVDGKNRIVVEDLRLFIRRTAARLAEKGGKNSFGQKRANLGEQFASYLEEGRKFDPKKEVAKKDMAKKVSKKQLRQFLKKTAPHMLRNMDDMLSTYTGDEIVSDAMKEFGSAPQHTFVKKPRAKPWFQLLGLTNQQTRQGVYELQDGKHCGRDYYKCSVPEPPDKRRCEVGEGGGYIYYYEKKRRWLIGPQLGCTTNYAMYSKDPEAQTPEEISELWMAYDGSGWRAQPGLETRWPGQKELDPKDIAKPNRRLPMNWAPAHMSRSLTLFSYCGTTCPIIAIAVLCVLGLLYAISSCSVQHGCATRASFLWNA